jgi:hypothetical protein
VPMGQAPPGQQQVHRRNVLARRQVGRHRRSGVGETRLIDAAKAARGRSWRGRRPTSPVGSAWRPDLAGRRIWPAARLAIRPSSSQSSLAGTREGASASSPTRPTGAAQSRRGVNPIGLGHPGRVA